MYLFSGYTRAHIYKCPDQRSVPDMTASNKDCNVSVGFRRAGAAAERGDLKMTAEIEDLIENLEGAEKTRQHKEDQESASLSRQVSQSVSQSNMVWSKVYLVIFNQVVAGIKP